MLFKYQQFLFNLPVISLNNEEKIFLIPVKLIISFTISLCLSLPVIAKDSINTDEEMTSGVIFPLTRLYPDYIANPLRPTFSFQGINYSETTITDTSRRRFDLKVGGNIGVYRSQPEKNKRGWQFTLGAGFHGEFDPESAEDNVGWDGIIALSIEMRFNETFAHRFGLHHISSHIGDELIERTGLKRINYTRQEIRYGLMWFMSPHWQSYLEVGRAYDLRNKLLQKRWRTELGIQYENNKYWSSKLGWYMGGDFSGYEENNWDINTALQLGLVTSINNKKFRLGFELYNGRSPLGEFFQTREKYIGLGFWIDI